MIEVSRNTLLIVIAGCTVAGILLAILVPRDHRTPLAVGMVTGCTTAAGLIVWELML